MVLKQPRIVKVQPDSEEKAVSQAVEVLKRGSLVILPTDTVYGIAADPLAPGAEERLFEAKGRDRSKPIPLLASDIGQVERRGAVLGVLEKKIVEKFWPGPLTLVLNVGNQPPEGFRIPDCEVTLAVLRKAGGVLRVTSANRSGEPPAVTAEQACRSLGSFVEVVLDAGAVPGGTPSTVIRVVLEPDNGDRKPGIRILREGAISSAEFSTYNCTVRGGLESVD